MHRLHTRLTRRIMIGVITLSGVTFGGNCGSNEFSLTTFRDTASDDIADGLALLTQGFVTGVFAGLAADGPSDETETEVTP